MPFSLLRIAEDNDSPFEVYIHVPNDVETLTKLPIVVFLHGAGERGTNPTDVLREEFRSVVQELALPAIWIFPQCSADHRAFYGTMESRVLRAIESVRVKFDADPARIYLAGYSMGATSCLYLSVRQPEKFAGIISIAVGITWEEEQLPPNLPQDVTELFVSMFISPDRAQFIAEHIATVPIWLIHGSSDDQCPVTESRSLALELQKRGAEPKLTEYANAGHNILTRAMREQGLFGWLFKQSAHNNSNC
jgi:predicted peptidase